MLIYKDILSGDEILSDSYKMECIDGVIYKVRGKMTSENQGIDDALIGGNKSAEGGDDDGACDGVVTGVDIVLTHKLRELVEYDKKSYLKILKVYLKKIFAKHAEAEMPADKVKEYQDKIQQYAKNEILPNFKEFQFYAGENLDATPDEGECMMILVKWDGEVPEFYYFAQGLIEEKV